MPVVAIEESDVCVLGTGQGDAPKPHGRHIGTAPSSGVPLLANGWTCCDGVKNTYVEQSCFPFGDPVGLQNRAIMYATNVQNCPSFGVARTFMDYAAGAWTATLLGLTMSLTCNPDEPDPTSPNKFLLTLGGCHYPTATITGTLICLDPIWIDYNNIVLYDCCECPEHSTDTAPTINISIRLNCRHVAWARYVGFTQYGVPVVAKEVMCVWDDTPGLSCNEIACELHAAITNVSGCECMVMSFLLCHNGTGQWNFPGAYVLCIAPSCDAPSTGSLTCVDNGDGTSTFTFTIHCGTVNNGSGFVIVNNEDIEALDITIRVTMTASGTPCSGSCRYQWNEMAQQWAPLDNTCTGDCFDCDPLPSLPPGTFDGQITSLPCTGPLGALGCCVGSFDLRVTR